MSEVPVYSVAIALCALCLDGHGGECHVPACALFLKTSPDIRLRDVSRPEFSLAVHAGPGVCEAGCPHFPWRCGGSRRLVCIACAPPTTPCDCFCTAEIDCPGCEDCAGPQGGQP